MLFNLTNYPIIFCLIGFFIIFFKPKSYHRVVGQVEGRLYPPLKVFKGVVRLQVFHLHSNGATVCRIAIIVLSHHFFDEKSRPGP